MVAPALWLTAAAMLLLAIGILLWQNARALRHRQAASIFVDQQIRKLVPQPEAETAGVADRPVFLALLSSFRPWRRFFLRAGVTPGVRLYTRLLLPALALATLATIFGGVLAMIGILSMYIVLVYLYWWLKIARRHQKMVHQLPSFLDTMVRLTTIGNSLESAFQAALLTVDAPLQEPLNRANLFMQAGRELEPALVQEARIFDLTELELIAVIMGVALRFGGRADVVLERMSFFIRDREQAQNELRALSTEIRLSAWVLGLMPIGLGIFMMIFNNEMFTMMWNDDVGKKMLLGAVVLEVVGAYWLYRLAKSI